MQKSQTKTYREFQKVIEVMWGSQELPPSKRDTPIYIYIHVLSIQAHMIIYMYNSDAAEYVCVCTLYRFLYGSLCVRRFLSFENKAKPRQHPDPKRQPILILKKHVKWTGERVVAVGRP